MILRNLFHFFYLGNVFARNQSVKYDTFPSNFVFGVGSSAYRVEGAWNASGKGKSIFDHAVPSKNVSNGDVACDSYHKYREDIRMLTQLKVQSYRFSLSWTRLFPTGRVNVINHDGVNYYNNLINGLLDSGISPMVTIYHWDTPQVLKDLGGWMNEEMIVWCREYADDVFELFGDRVGTWFTFNEPATSCSMDLNNPGIGSYQCAHNIIRAHAEVYHLYRNKYKRKQNGKVGITLDLIWAVPLNPKSKRDKKAAECAMEFNFGWFAWPIFRTGDCPLSMRRRVDQRSGEQGFCHSRLPGFTNREKRMIYKSSDYLGLNHYVTQELTFANAAASAIPTKLNDGDFIISTNPEWKTTSVPGFTITPDTLRKLLLWVGDSLGHSWPVYVTENGYNGDAVESLDDSERIDYLNGYVQAVLDAMNQGAGVVGCSWWSFMDGYEWVFGYTYGTMINVIVFLVISIFYRRKFGLYSVDFDDENRTRTPRGAAVVYQSIVVTGKVDPNFNPTHFVH